QRALESLLASGRIETVRRWATLARSFGVSDPTLVLAEAEIALRERDLLRAQTLAQYAASQLPGGDASARAHLTAARAAHLREDSLAAQHLSNEGASIAESADLRRESLWLAFLTAFEAESPDTRERLEKLEAFHDSGADHAVRLAAAKGLMTVEWE